MPTARRVTGLIGALFIIVIGLLAGAAGVLVALAGPGENRLMLITVAGSMLAVSLGLGLPLAWQAGQALRNAPSAPFQPRRTWVLGVLLALVLIGGQAILALDLAPALTFPPFYVAAVALPPLIVLGLAGRGLAGRTRWRELVVEVSSGAFASTLIAFVLEIGAVLGLVFAAALAFALSPEGAERLRALADSLQDPALVQDPALPARLAGSPWVIMAVLAVLAGIVPLIEEAVKTLGVGLLLYRRPTQSQAFLWGLAGGAGFALAEGLLNSATGLDSWLVVALSRVGATLLHCFTGGLMGLAWYQATSRRWGRVAGLYAASVATHAVWNSLAAGLTLISLRSGSTVTGPSAVLANGALLAIVALFLGVGGMVTAGLAVVTWRLRRTD